MGRYSNISIARYRRVLKHLGLSHIRTKSGHEMWFRDGMLRNVVFQTHIEPIPEAIILNNLSTMGITKKEFDDVLKNIR